MADKRSKGHQSNRVALIFLIAASTFLLLSVLQLRQPNEPQKASRNLGPEKKRVNPGVDIHSPEHLESINRHLKSTAANLSLQRQSVQVQNYGLLLKNQYKRQEVEGDAMISEESSMHGPALNAPVEPDEWADLAAKIRDPQYSNPSVQEPGDAVQFELFQQQQDRDYSEAYKKAYAEAFVANAKKAGYEVKLSPDYRVLSVRKYAKPRAPSLFDE